jgi:5-methylthioadenosine/S-adenosylhomocysteine deaminase
MPGSAVTIEGPVAEDRFEELFQAGVTHEVHPPALVKQTGRELPVRAAPAQAVALHGCVLTPERAIEDSYVVVGAGNEIHAVQATRPDGVRVHETGGVILPGLLDLHGHPEFNVFAPWEPPRQFVNRYAWRGSEIYDALVRDPQNRLLGALPPKTQLRYAEIRALVGGVTAIQGTGGAATSYQDEALVRNVDKWIFGRQVGRSLVDLPAGSRGLSALQSILDGIEAGKVEAFYIHLAEGRSDNERSRKELDRLVELKALTEKTVVIHGTALDREQLGQLRDAGAKLVWSPQSNLRLYGATTKAADALELGLPVALGADWLPSGSPSLLAEMKVARRCLGEQNGPTDARRLVQMVTRDAAEIAGLGDKLGALAEGRPADVLVLERHVEDPWENVLEADPSWVELVMVDGDLAYGRIDWLTSLAGPAQEERFERHLAWGKPVALDTSYSVKPDGDSPPKLSELSAALINEYPPVGPIFA